jgi:hypothetical protein
MGLPYEPRFLKQDKLYQPIWGIFISFYLTTQKLNNHLIINIRLPYLLLSNEDKEKGKYVICSLILLHNSCMKLNEAEFSFKVIHFKVLAGNPFLRWVKFFDGDCNLSLLKTMTQ